MGIYNFKMPAMLMCDFYKVAHREQYPDKTQVIFSTWTPRTSRIDGIEEVVHFGLQGFTKEMLIDYFNDNFFNRPKDEVVAEYVRYMKYCLFQNVTYTKHIEDLHDLGYLPISIRAVDEGTAVPIRVPMVVVNNTDERFFWLVNYLETPFSCECWQQSTDATIANKYRRILDRYAMETVGNTDFVQFQGHDFSMRGMAGWIASAKASAGHLLSFVGTDTIPAIAYHEAYYNANIENELVGCSVPATEHSVACAGGATYGMRYEAVEEEYDETSGTWKVLRYLTPDEIPASR